MIRSSITVSFKKCVERSFVRGKVGTSRTLPMMYYGASLSCSLSDASERCYHNTATLYEKHSNSNMNSSSSTDGTFYSTDIQTKEALSNLLPDATADATADVTGDLIFTPNYYNPVDITIEMLNYIDSLHDLPFVYTIIGSTLGFRTILLPIFIKGQQNASRMAHMTPELNVLKERIERLKKSNPDSDKLSHHAQEMNALFRKYQCHPLKGVIPPLIQMPLFVSFFFALRKMPDYFSGPLMEGGIAWFPDLTAADPLYILPVASSLTFLGTIEISKQSMQQNLSSTQGNLMTNVFRGMAVLMIPATLYFPSAALIYWVTNNTISFIQTAAFQQPAIRKALDIWAPPPPKHSMAGSKGSQPQNLSEMMGDLFQSNKKDNDLEEKKQAMKKHNEEIEHRKMEQVMKRNTYRNNIAKKKKGRK